MSRPRRSPIRPFTEQERQTIGQALRAAGRTLFAAQGWKKTGIDDLCRAAGIARGTFYLFHPSKDAFFLSLLSEAEQAVKEELLTFLADPGLDGPATLQALLDACLTLIDRHPLVQFAFADPQDAAPWIRSLGGSMEILLQGDTETAAQVLEVLRGKGLSLATPPDVFAGLLRALVLLPLSKRIIGEDVYVSVRETLASALARGLS